MFVEIVTLTVSVWDSGVRLRISATARAIELLNCERGRLQKVLATEWFKG